MTLLSHIFMFMAIFGWIVGLLINHAANVIPLRESLAQRPFCKRRRFKQGDPGPPEFISISQKGETLDSNENEATPLGLDYCHAPKSAAKWSALIAYLIGQQRCQRCGREIGWRSLLVELLTPLAFIFLSNHYLRSNYAEQGPADYVLLSFLLLYTAILILLTVTDLEHRLIQPVIILPAILAALTGAFLNPTYSWKQAIVGGATGLVVFYVLALLSRGGLGRGDVTLASFLGLITGFPNVILVIFFGIFLGGLVGGILLLTRLVTLKTYIPYGPFLIIAGWTVMIWGDQLFRQFWG